MLLPYYKSGNSTIILLHGDVITLELGMIGVIISAIVYGGILTLSVSYVPLLLKTSNDISRRMRNFLLLYVILMVAISTVYMITAIATLTRSVFSDPKFFWNSSSATYVFENGLVGAACTTVASWGADGFMVSRFDQKNKYLDSLSFTVRMIAVAMCNAIPRSFATSSNNIDRCFHFNGNHFIWCAPLVGYFIFHFSYSYFKVPV